MLMHYHCKSIIMSICAPNKSSFTIRKIIIAIIIIVITITPKITPTTIPAISLPPSGFIKSNWHSA